jgi:hypothetical protein
VLREPPSLSSGNPRVAEILESSRSGLRKNRRLPFKKFSLRLKFPKKSVKLPILLTGKSIDARGPAISLSKKFHLLPTSAKIISPPGHTTFLQMDHFRFLFIRTFVIILGKNDGKDGKGKRSTNQGEFDFPIVSIA